MKVIGVTEYGGPDAWRVFDVPEPHAGPGEVRIRVRAAAVNPTDTLVRNGSRAEAQKEFAPPYVPGMDAAGTIDEICEGIDAAPIGARSSTSPRLRRRGVASPNARRTPRCGSGAPHRRGRRSTRGELQPGGDCDLGNRWR